MKRSTIGSLLFIGGTLVFLLAPSSESSAQGGDAPRPRRTSTDQSAVAIAAGVTPPHDDRSRRAPSPRTPASRASTAPDLGTSGGNCGENQVEVDGDYCPALEQKCIRWMDPETTIPRRCAEFAPTGKCQGKTDQEALLHRQATSTRTRLGEKPVVMKTWYEARRRLQGAGQAPLRRQRVDARVRRPGAPPVPVRLRAQLAGVQHRQAAPGREREVAIGEPAHPRRRGRAPLAGREQRLARVVRQPLRRDRHDRQRRRVGRQRERHARTRAASRAATGARSAIAAVR